jgi:branched-chain amino acid transport system permease protein
VGLFSSGIKDAIAFLILLVILMARPSGILGQKAATRF